MSSSRSSTAQTSSATDNRRVIGEGGFSAEGSTVNVLDGGAVNAAFQYGGDAVGRALDFAHANSDGALGVIGQAISEMGASEARVLDFGSDAMSGAFQASDRARTQAFDFGADALASAFQFGREANTKAQDAIDSTANMVKNAYADAKGRGAMTDYIMIGAIALMALVAWGAIKK